MKSTALAVGAALVAVMINGIAASATEQASSTCSELNGLRIPAEVIGLPTTGGEVTTSEVVAAQGAVGEYCKVDADLFPVDPEAPSIKMRVALPSTWNSKAFMFGGGGTNGNIPDLGSPVPFGPGAGSTPLARGFAVFGSDSGHEREITPGTILPSDHSFGANEEALRNFAGDALKKTRDAAMFLVAEHYGQQPAHSYFAGGSTGGREALAVAQRWPRDFDGVISGYPAHAAATLNLWFGYMGHVLSRPGAFPDPVKQKLLQRAVIEKCDALDGLEDGVISDEAGCESIPRRCAAQMARTNLGASPMLRSPRCERCRLRSSGAIRSTAGSADTPAFPSCRAPTSAFRSSGSGSCRLPRW